MAQTLPAQMATGLLVALVHVCVECVERSQICVSIARYSISREARVYGCGCVGWRGRSPVSGRLSEGIFWLLEQRQIMGQLYRKLSVKIVWLRD